MYLLVDKIEEKEGRKYSKIKENISLTDGNSEVLKKYAELWSGIKGQIIKLNNGKLGKDWKLGKDYMKIKFDSDDDLPLNKILKFRILTIIIRNIFEKNGKYYPQIFLDDALYEV